MNKSDLISKMSTEAGITKPQATSALQAFYHGVIEALANGDTVQLVGFGTFSVKERAARTGRNPKTGEPIEIPASKTVGFKVGKGLKGAVND